MARALRYTLLTPPLRRWGRRSKPTDNESVQCNAPSVPLPPKTHCQSIAHRPCTVPLPKTPGSRPHTHINGPWDATQGHGGRRGCGRADVRDTDTEGPWGGVWTSETRGGGGSEGEGTCRRRLPGPPSASLWDGLRGSLGGCGVAVGGGGAACPPVLMGHPPSPTPQCSASSEHSPSAPRPLSSPFDEECGGPPQDPPSAKAPGTFCGVRAHASCLRPWSRARGGGGGAGPTPPPLCPGPRVLPPSEGGGGHGPRGMSYGGGSWPTGNVLRRGQGRPVKPSTPPASAPPPPLCLGIPFGPGHWAVIHHRRRP